jgi:hypothetical protein
VLALAGDTLYAGSGGGVHGTLVAYARDAATGALEERAQAESPAAPGIEQPAQIVAARGALYVASTVSGAVTRFDRSLRETGIARGLRRPSGLAVTDRVQVACRDGIASLTLALAPAGRTKLANATGVAGYGRFVYAVSPGRISTFVR